MQIDLLMKIAGIGVMTWIISMVLRQAGREEAATLAAVAGLVAALLLVVDAVGKLLSQVQSIFQLY